jgi:hypothetical protein
VVEEEISGVVARRVVDMIVFVLFVVLQGTTRRKK